MTDKFVVSTNEIGAIIVTDVETGNVYRYDNLSHFLGLIRLLNEQEATIKELKEENKKLREEWEFSFRTELAHHRVAEKELKEKIREQQATIEEYEDFCLNLCKFLIGKGLVDEYREEYGKEYKIITKWKGCGSDE